MQRLKAVADHLGSGKLKTTQHPLSPPSLHELVDVILPALEKNFDKATVAVEPSPDLRQAPYHLAAEGISGNECVADIGGPGNLFPIPRLECKYSMLEVAEAMQMRPERGQLLGAGAGPYHRIGVNSELATNFSWKDSFEHVKNQSYYTKLEDAEGEQRAVCAISPTTDCALMMNLYGSTGLPGDVLKITARARRGAQKSFTECIRQALAEHYGAARPISIGGVFLIRAGTAKFHVMPDFPPAERLPFRNGKAINDWLAYYDFDAPVVCLSVFHSADPEELGLRMEHTHCFSTDGKRGGHYHYDLPAGEGEEIEYEAYFNTAKVLYRVDKPAVTMPRD